MPIGRSGGRVRAIPCRLPVPAVTLPFRPPPSPPERLNILSGTSSIAITLCSLYPPMYDTGALLTYCECALGGLYLLDALLYMRCWVRESGKVWAHVQGVPSPPPSLRSHARAVCRAGTT